MDKSEYWIQSYLGKQLFPFAPKPEDVDIRDIAHSLSLLCRFNGHCQSFYCVTPKTRILRSDLKWVEAGNIKTGDILFGFDEYPDGYRQPNRKARRRIKPSIVLHDGLIRRPVYRLHLSDGSSICSSADHPWLISAKISRNQKWEKTSVIAHDVNDLNRKRYMLRFIHPWGDPYNDYKSGYIAGIFDGEGHVCFHYGGVTIGMGQKKGIVLDTVLSYLKSFGFECLMTSHPQSGVVQLVLAGKWTSRMKFLGLIQPKRLIKKMQDRFEKNDLRITFPSTDMLQIEKVEYLGRREVSAIETSSKTYFAEGFGSHNSVAEHSVRVAELLERNGGPWLRVWGLLHDAAENVCGDLPHPIKLNLPEFDEMEDKIQSAILAGLRIPPIPESKYKIIKKADNILLATEKRDIMREGPGRWTLKEKPLDTYIIPHTPQEAERMFLDKWHEYRGT